MADMRHDFVHTVHARTDTVDVGALAAMVSEFTGEGRRRLHASGVAFTEVRTQPELDMRYLGQTHTIAASLPDAGPLDRAAIERAFEDRYRRSFGRLLPGVPVRILNLRVSVIGVRPKLDLATLAPAGAEPRAKSRQRRIYVAGEWREAAIVAREGLRDRRHHRRPRHPRAERHDDPDRAGQAARVDGAGNLLLRAH